MVCRPPISRPAKQGALLIYRYAWQPLSFELSSWLWSLF